MRIGLVYEHAEDIQAIVKRLDETLAELGHQVEVDYKHLEDIERIGWIIVMMKVFHRCDGFIGVQTLSGPEKEGKFRGLNEELALIDAIKKPLAMTVAYSWRGLHDEEVREHCATLVNYLKYKLESLP